MSSIAPELTLGQIISELWARKRLILIVTFATGIIAAIITLFLPLSFRAEVLMAPPEKNSESGGLAALAGQFSGIADLAGVNLQGGSDVDQSIALLTSRQFTEQFMVNENVLQAMYPEKWDATHNRWKTGDGESGGSFFSWLTSKVNGQAATTAPRASPDGRPSLWVAFKKFDKLRRISKDKKTNLITLTVDWRDPTTAARWANDMVTQINRHARDRAIDAANRSLEYLNQEARNTHEVEMEQTVYRLVERQMRTKMSANVNDEYAFRVLDPAVPPEQRESPKRTLLTLAAMFIAGFITSVWILFGPRSGVGVRG